MFTELSMTSSENFFRELEQKKTSVYGGKIHMRSLKYLNLFQKGKSLFVFVHLFKSII